MITINLIVNDQQIELAEPVTIVSGSENVYLCKFTFTEEWTGFEKTAVFLSRTDAREVYMSNNQCTIPWEALEIDDIRRQELKIGVYGVKDDVRMPTVYTKPLSVHPGAETAEGGGTPTPTQWEEIMEMLADGTIYVDSTLTTPGKGADAAVTGDEFKKAVQSSLLYLQASNTHGYSDANDFPANKIINISSNITAALIANLPAYGEPSYVLTMTYDPASAYSAQVFFGRDTTAVRMKLLSGWTAWRIEANIADVLKYALQTTGSYASLGAVPENVISGLNFTTAGWSDAPEGAQYGILISSQVSANYKLQMVLEYGDNKHIWWRIVNRASPYATLVDWQKTPTSAELETVQSYANKLVTSISSYMTSHNITTLAQLPENIITLASSAIEDAPFANAVFFNMRYSTNFAIQFAFTLSSRQMAYRIVNRSTGVPYNDWATMNMLNPNTVLSMGDSISYGSRNDWKGFLGDIFPKAARKKVAAPGACLSNKRMTNSTTEKKRLCIYQQLLDFISDPNNVGYAPDIIVGNGGVNDYVYGSPLGTLPTQPATDATAAEALNKATLLGGLEYLFYLMITNYPKAQRFFVLTHRTKTWPWTAGSQGYTQTQMNEAITAVCKIYGVEVIDVFNRGMINTAFSEYISPEDYDDEGNTDEDKARITNSYYVDSDGIHPLALGYKEGYVPIVRAALGIGTHKEAEES